MSETKPETRHAVAKIADIPVGERIIAKILAFGKQIEIGVFNPESDEADSRQVPRERRQSPGYQPRAICGQGKGAQ